MPPKAKLLTNVGGIAFFSSLFFLVVLATANSFILLQLVTEASMAYWSRFIAAAIIGAVAAKLFVPHRMAVFLHELKHSIISSLAGNKPKGLQYKGKDPKFTFQYTKKTEAYNAFIALAPYWFPFFTLFCIALSAALLRPYHLLMVMFIGLGYGGDMALNIEEISPRQTDISNIRGGYLVGLIYIIAMNLTLLTILAAWAGRGGWGLKFLLFSLWDLVKHVMEVYLI